MAQDICLFLAEAEGIDQANEKHMLIFDELVGILLEHVLVREIIAILLGLRLPIPRNESSFFKSADQTN